MNKDDKNIKDILEKLKDLIKSNEKITDVDFYVFPDLDKKNKKPSKNQPDNKSSKGFKISYHFEKDDNKPKIRIEEGDYDLNKMRDYMKRILYKAMINQRKKRNLKSFKKFDANEFKLEPPKTTDKKSYLEPYTELNRIDDTFKIIMEVPGMTNDDVVLSLINNGKLLLFSAQNKNRRYVKRIELPFKTSMDSTNFEINNGIAIIKLEKE
jgi:HSP20 family molecular chaperone IbpA